MTLTIQLFGPYAKAVGQSQLSVEHDQQAPMTAAGLLALLGRKYPAMAPLLISARLAVNSRYVAPDHPLSPEDELAIIGLVGGG